MLFCFLEGSASEKAWQDPLYSTILFDWEAYTTNGIQ
jgi:hypothetical protein